MSLLEQHQSRFQQAIAHFKEELLSLKSGRATPALVERLSVMAYGTLSPLKQLASIAVADSRTLVIDPWDKNLMKDVEKAIAQTNLNLNPIVDGKVIRLVIPPLNEESRKEFVKILNQKVETARVAVRQIRDDIRNQIMTQEKSGEVTEDEKYSLLKKLDEFVGDYNQEIKQLAEEKTSEIMTI